MSISSEMIERELLNEKIKEIKIPKLLFVPFGKDEKDWIVYLNQSFAKDGYRFPELLRRIATSDAFYAISDAKGWVLGETLEHALAALKRDLE